MVTVDPATSSNAYADASVPKSALRIWLRKGLPEIVVALVFVLVQSNGVQNTGYMGQDYEIHKGWMEQARANPWSFLTEEQPPVLGISRTSPLLYHLLAAAAASWGPFSRDRNVGLFNLLTGLGGLFLFMATARIWIGHVAIRTSLYLFLAFLPVFCIHNLVMAADVLTMPAGGMILLGISKVLAERGRAARLGIALITIGLLVGILTKYTFSVAPLAVLILAILLARRRDVPRRRLVWLLSAGFCVPSLVAGGIWLHSHKTLDSHFKLDKLDPERGTSFSLSDVLLLKSNDVDLLEAIPYSRRRDLLTQREDSAPYPEVGKEPGENRVFSLLEAHRYSYQALLVDALFSDIMNVRQKGRTGLLYFGPRSTINQQRMNGAIKGGWLLYFLGLLTTGWALFGSLRRGRSIGDNRSFFILNALALALLLAGPVIVTMLYAYDGYGGGYWMPRLILFALASALLACFTWLDLLNRRFSRRLGWPLLAISLSQAALYVSFLVVY